MQIWLQLKTRNLKKLKIYAKVQMWLQLETWQTTDIAHNRCQCERIWIKWASREYMYRDYQRKLQMVQWAITTAEKESQGCRRADKVFITEQNRREQSRTEQSRIDKNRAEQNSTEQMAKKWLCPVFSLCWLHPSQWDNLFLHLPNIASVVNVNI